MPCGGIYPIEMETKNFIRKCYFCTKSEPIPRHFIEEFDDFIHAVCVPDFLKTSEGAIIINHRHDIYLSFEVES